MSLFEPEDTTFGDFLGGPLLGGLHALGFKSAAVEPTDPMGKAEFEGIFGSGSWDNPVVHADLAMALHGTPTAYGKVDKDMLGNYMDTRHYDTFAVGTEGADPFNKYSDPYYHNGNKNEEEESGIEPVVLSAGTSFDPSGWQLTPAPYVPYTPPAAQDWSAWMFGSPFGGQGGLAYQPGSQEYLEQYIPQNVWGSAPGLSEGVMAELAPSTGGLLEV